MSQIDEALNNITRNIQRDGQNADAGHVENNKPVCPVCKGLGYVRRDLPVGHPDFGKVTVCSCSTAAAHKAEIEKLYYVSNLAAFKNATFDTFNPNGKYGLSTDQINSLKIALAQARKYATELSGWLVMLGGFGCGKTHLAAAIANNAINQGTPVLFQTEPDLLDWMRYSYTDTEGQTQSFEERIKKIKDIPLLVLDDLGTQNATPWAQEKIYQIINYRYTNKLPMIVTSNNNLREVEGRVRSRLEDAEISTCVNIFAPDYRANIIEEPGQQVSSLPLHHKRTFETFNDRSKENIPREHKDNLSKVIRAAKSYAEKPEGWLVILGRHGCGKTHLAAAIGNHRATAGDSAIMTVTADLLDHLRSTFSPGSGTSYNSLFNQVRSAPLLILDDLNMSTAGEWARVKLCQILNHRYVAELPTIITAVNLANVDEQVQCRLYDTDLCATYEITVPPYKKS